MKHHAYDNKRESHYDRIEYHCFDIEAKAFLRSRTDTGNADTHQFNELARRYTIEYLEAANQFQDKLCCPAR